MAAKRHANVKPKREAPVVATRRKRATPIEYLEAQLAALEEAERAAFEDGSWVAYATIKRQQREVFDRVHELREAEQRASRGPTLTDEQILHQHLIPSIAKLPLPAAWEVYQALGLRLGQGSARADDDAEAS